MLMTVVLVTSAIYVYFTNILFYEPSFRELYVFNSIFSFITLLYVVLYLGHYFLFRKNTKQLEEEALAKRSIERDFSSYLKGIHPELLFESLEAMLVSMKDSPEKAEELSDHFSEVYRYILSKRKREMVTLQEELEVTQKLIQLVNHLPHRKIQLGKTVQKAVHIVPTALLKLVEAVVRTTIPAANKVLVMVMEDQGKFLRLRYKPEEKLQESLTVATLGDIARAYQFYSEEPLQVHREGDFKIIQLPKLTYYESSDP